MCPRTQSPVAVLSCPPILLSNTLCQICFVHENTQEQTKNTLIQGKKNSNHKSRVFPELSHTPLTKGLLSGVGLTLPWELLHHSVLHSPNPSLFLNIQCSHTAEGAGTATSCRDSMQRLDLLISSPPAAPAAVSASHRHNCASLPSVSIL